jgi:hypothetical protein
VELNLEKRQQVCDMSSELHAVKRSENQKSLFVTEVWQGLVMGFSFSHLDADQGRRNGLGFVGAVGAVGACWPLGWLPRG